MKKRFLGLIPARGGSKGIPRKNIKDLAGKPLIAWTIEAAQRSSFLENVVVSTDDAEIAEVAKAHGASVPFLRPAKFAADESPGIDPVIHAIEMMPGFDYVVLLQPTSPLRSTEDIDKAINHCLTLGSPSCVSVVETATHPFLCYSVDDKFQLSPAFSEGLKYTRRQDMPSYYMLNGAIYVAKVDFILKNRSFIGPETIGYTMPDRRSIDIDNELDFEWANFLLSKDLKSSGNI